MEGLIESGRLGMTFDSDADSIANDAVTFADALLARLAKEERNG